MLPPVGERRRLICSTPILIPATTRTSNEYEPLLYFGSAKGSHRPSSGGTQPSQILKLNTPPIPIRSPFGLCQILRQQPLGQPHPPFRPHFLGIRNILPPLRHPRLPANQSSSITPKPSQMAFYGQLSKSSKLHLKIILNITREVTVLSLPTCH